MPEVTGYLPLVAPQDDEKILSFPDPSPERTCTDSGSCWPVRSWCANWHRVSVIAAFALVAIYRLQSPSATSWHYFVTASEAVNGANWVHLYARHPELQFGPVSAYSASLVRYIGGSHAVGVLQIALSCAFVAIVWMLDAFAISVGVLHARRRRLVAAGGLLLAVPWTELSVTTGHLDDAIAMVAIVASVSATARGRTMLAALCLALAVDAKPWACVLIPILFVERAPRAWRGIGIAVTLIATAWLPFIVGDPSTLGATRFTIANDVASSLRWLGVRDARTPVWDRPAQLAIGLGLACWFVRRGRWQAVFLGGVAARLLLDPGTHKYYAVGLILGAIVYDISIAARRMPLMTATMFALVYLPVYVPWISASERGALRLLACSGAIVMSILSTRNGALSATKSRRDDPAGRPMKTVSIKQGALHRR